RRLPTGQFLVTALGIGMPQSVHPGQTGADGLALIDPKLLPVIAVAGNQRTLARQLMGAIEHGPLQRTPNRDGSRLAALGPGGLEFEIASLIGVARAELDGFLP